MLIGHKRSNHRSLSARDLDSLHTNVVLGSGRLSWLHWDKQQFWQIEDGLIKGYERCNSGGNIRWKDTQSTMQIMTGSACTNTIPVQKLRCSLLLTPIGVEIHIPSPWLLPRVRSCIDLKLHHLLLLHQIRQVEDGRATTVTSSSEKAPKTQLNFIDIRTVTMYDLQV